MKGSRKGLFFILACMLGFQLAFAGFSFAVGAISYSEDEDAYGFITGQPDKTKAFAEAKKLCKEAGGKNCKDLVWFKKCGALATSKEYWGYGYGDAKAEAEKNAKSACKGKDKKIAVSGCE
jgi:hypothetical protein